MSANAQIAELMVSRVRSKSEELRAKSFDQLAQLPERQAEKVDVLGKFFGLTVYRVQFAVDEVFVVVQAYRERWFGMAANVKVEGFISRSNGEVKDAPEEMLWDYT